MKFQRTEERVLLSVSARLWENWGPGCDVTANEMLGGIEQATEDDLRDACKTKWRVPGEVLKEKRAAIVAQVEADVELLRTWQQSPSTERGNVPLCGQKECEALARAVIRGPES
jgi:hypothetical protein